ncbi:hypothetical protein NQZ68_005893 [Dissostichus eleginoides]|nr:hypothetical protein NQZ68_005893 [Dissostichus eleginoides]
MAALPPLKTQQASELREANRGYQWLYRRLSAMSFKCTKHAKEQQPDEFKKVLSAAARLAKLPMVVATAMNKMHETLDVVQLMGLWTVWSTRGGTQQADGQADQSPVKKAISVALDSALMISEALVDRVLPPTDEDKGRSSLDGGFEAATLGRSFPLRLVSLSTKMLRRTQGRRVL